MSIRVGRNIVLGPKELVLVFEELLGLIYLFDIMTSQL